MAPAPRGHSGYVVGSVRLCPSPDYSEILARTAHGPGAFLSLTTRAKSSRSLGGRTTNIRTVELVANAAGPGPCTAVESIVQGVK
jgi:hypothetical protein